MELGGKRDSWACFMVDSGWSFRMIWEYRPSVRCHYYLGDLAAIPWSLFFTSLLFDDLLFFLSVFGFGFSFV